MQTAVLTALSKTIASDPDGAWFNIGTVSSWSLYVTGLEAGGVVTVYGSNLPTNPGTATPADPGIAMNTINTSGSTLVTSSTPIEWIRVMKVPGTGTGAAQPTLTTAYLKTASF